MLLVISELCVMELQILTKYIFLRLLIKVSLELNKSL